MPKCKLVGQAGAVLKNQLLDTNEIFGALSPMSKVTLGPEGKSAAGIPEEATSYCFAYPSERKFEVPPSVHSDADLSFLTLGGYVYFDDDMDPSAFACVPGASGLRFAPPLPLSGLRFQGQFDLREVLSHRFKPISHSHTAGAKFVCWILPGELDECPHGSLAFLFHSPGVGSEDELKRDLMFPVLGSAQLHGLKAFAQS